MSRQNFNEVFAELGSIVDPGVAKIKQGWIVEAPPSEHFNFWQNKADQMLQYYERNGIAEYDASTIYDVGGLTKVGGIAFKSLVGNNTGNTPASSPTEWVVAYLIPANNLSDLENAGTARTNLDVDSTGEAEAKFAQVANDLSDLNSSATARSNISVYSKAESDADYASRADNLSDLANVGTARNNISVYSKAESDADYASRADNLSDLASIPTARTNLSVYSKAESDADYLSRLDNLSDLDNTGTARNNLDVYDKGTVDSKLAVTAFAQTEGSSFFALADHNKSAFAGSGFTEYGKHLTSVGDAVNEGIWSNETSPNKLFIGRTSNAVGTSRTNEPISNINGVLQAIQGVQQSVEANIASNELTFPDAPDGKVTYDTSTGVNTVHADPATAFASLEKVVNGNFATDTDWTKGTGWAIAGGQCTYTGGSGFTLLEQGSALITGETYIVRLQVAQFQVTGSFFVYTGDSTTNVPVPAGVDGDVVELEFVATGTETVQVGSSTATDIVFDSISVTKVTESVTVSRKDLVILESWHEVIDDKDVVYPLGNVQYGVSTFEGITLSNTVVAQGYSAFGEWDTATQGFGVVYSTLTDDDKAIFLSDPLNNIYLNEDGDLVQVRYRVRVIEGLGDDWENAFDLQSPNANVSYEDAERRIKPRGKLVTIPSDLDGFGDGTVGGYGRFDAVSIGVDVVIGAWAANGAGGIAAPAYAYKGLAFVVPIALVQR